MKGFKVIFTKMFFVFLVIALLGGSIIPSTHAQDVNPTDEVASDLKVFNEHYSERYITLADGTKIVESIINGPPTPPLGQSEWINANDLQPEAIILPNFPSYSWVFGCTAVSAAMIAAYQDRNGYPNIYTGPTNGGVMPLSNVWGTWTDGNGDSYPSNPLIASQYGVDGRTTKGSIDDYWVSYGSTANDPFITGGWTEHTYGTAIGDYMKTSQSNFGNKDGSSKIYTWSHTSAPYTCADAANRSDPDANLGRMQFYQQRGYEVTTCYNQKTDNQVSGGFTLAQFKAEIDAGYPVMVHVVGHTMVGYGYDGSTIYIRDTWDNDPSKIYSMQWGGSYKNMQMHSVSVLRLKRPDQPSTGKLYLPMVFKPQLDYTIKNWNFEQGHVAWTEYSNHGWDLIMPGSEFPGTVKPYSGNWAVWLGGDYNDISSISQQVNVMPQKSLAVKFWIASGETSCTNDYLIIRVNNTEIGRIGLCEQNNTGGWWNLRANVSAYANQNVKITYEVRTNGSENSNVFLDDVTWGDPLINDVEGLEIIPSVQSEPIPGSELPKEK